ncbi:MAG: hypothetical protein KatS3mg102_0841 [Planctomycetota bacterium]|nr:MAG: hypothetical protein KatS3mg102_0841 [Planctomycetota bacterium]
MPERHHHHHHHHRGRRGSTPWPPAPRPAALAWLLAGAAVLAAGTGAARAQQQDPPVYAPFDVAPFEERTTISLDNLLLAVGVNSHGWVAGGMQDLPIIWRDGRQIPLEPDYVPLAGGVGLTGYSYALAINEQGWAVGRSSLRTHELQGRRAALWWPEVGADGSVNYRRVDLGIPLAAPDDTKARAYATDLTNVREDGSVLVCGYTQSPQFSNPSRSWILRVMPPEQVELVRVIEIVQPGVRTDATSINESGQVVGHVVQISHQGPEGPFVFTPGAGGAGELVLLPGLLADGSTVLAANAWDINDAGVIAGDAVDPEASNQVRAVLWEPDGQGGYRIRRLPAPGPARSSFAFGLNNHGVVVGGIEERTGDGLRKSMAFLWRPGQSALQLLPSPGGLPRAYAFGVSDSEPPLIAGGANVDRLSPYSYGRYESVIPVLWKPVAELPPAPEVSILAPPDGTVVDKTADTVCFEGVATLGAADISERMLWYATPSVSLHTLGRGSEPCFDLSSTCCWDDGPLGVFAVATAPDGTVGAASIRLELTTPPPLAVDLAADRSRYRTAQTAEFAVLVTDPAGVPVEGAQVTIAVRGANGQQVAALSGSTAADGSAVLGLRIDSAEGGRGTWTASASATHPDFLPGSDEVSFRVVK